MQKIVFIILLVLILIFLYQYNNIKKISIAIHNQTVTQLKFNQNLENRNMLKQIKISSLKGSNDAIETRARYEFNLVKPNETLIILPQGK